MWYCESLCMLTPASLIHSLQCSLLWYCSVAHVMRRDIDLSRKAFWGRIATLSAAALQCGSPNPMAATSTSYKRIWKYMLSEWGGTWEHDVNIIIQFLSTELDNVFTKLLASRFIVSKYIFQVQLFFELRSQEEQNAIKILMLQNPDRMKNHRRFNTITASRDDLTWCRKILL